MLGGLVTGRQAYDALTKGYGCHDERISPYNVLMMKIYKFEGYLSSTRKTLPKTTRPILAMES